MNRADIERSNLRDAQWAHELWREVREARRTATEAKLPRIICEPEELRLFGCRIRIELLKD